ncbi:hypothetical protein [Pseudoalteromonas shioyasakiensis]|uniref:hypothetical protein n=1 Tax=Pseudoalteromonas shioyasakiensis TaxID=1190813 RepID=UPI000781F757|nr:hypothetical protein [Pseudoalteromonas shioyasakiensis]
MAYICSKCKKTLESHEAYEYRGAIACEDHFDEVIEMRDFERNEIIQDEHNKTKTFKGLDISSSEIGKANRKLLKPHIEIASKESQRLREYEGR